MSHKVKFLLISVFVFFDLVFCSVGRVQATDRCTVTYSPSPILIDQPSTLSYQILSSGDPEATNCNLDNGIPSCFELRGCITTNQSTCWSDPASYPKNKMVYKYDLNTGGTLIADNFGAGIAEIANPLFFGAFDRTNFDILIWIDKNGRDYGCEHKSIHLGKTTAKPVCGANTISVVKNSDPANPDYVQGDAQLVLNSDATDNFWPTLGTWYIIVDPSPKNSIIRNISATASSGADGKLYRKAGGPDLSSLPLGDYNLSIRDAGGQTVCTLQSITLGTKPGEVSGSGGPSSFKECNQISDKLLTSDGKKAIEECQHCSPNGVWTALGCIPTASKGMLSVLIRIGLSIAGGVALLMIIAAAFMLTTSQGDQKRVTEAKELITSAVIGLVFIILSVTLLQFIGVTILQIPGFGG